MDEVLAMEFHDPTPRIEIPCRKIPLPGQQFRLEPSIQFQQMPGGWTTVHQILTQCLQIVAHQMVLEAQGGQERLIKVAQGPLF